MSTMSAKESLRSGRLKRLNLENFYETMYYTCVVVTLAKPSQLTCYVCGICALHPKSPACKCNMMRVVTSSPSMQLHRMRMLMSRHTRAHGHGRVLDWACVVCRALDPMCIPTLPQALKPGHIINTKQTAASGHAHVQQCTPAIVLPAPQDAVQLSIHNSVR